MCYSYIVLPYINHTPRYMGVRFMHMRLTYIGPTCMGLTPYVSYTLCVLVSD
jgi:hypothetical protein